MIYSEYGFDDTLQANFLINLIKKTKKIMYNSWSPFYITEEENCCSSYIRNIYVTMYK